MTNLKTWGSVFPVLPGAVGKPVPGYKLEVFNDKNEPCAPHELGKVVIKLPMPPAFMTSLWGNDEAFIEKYLKETPGYYTSGDAGIFDEHGYFHIMTRTDDVINTAGHRISTGRLEEAVNDHKDIVESAVIGYNDPLKGEVPVAFVVTRGDLEIDEKG
jgi:propionyl-CoA synthetase